MSEHKHNAETPVLPLTRQEREAMNKLSADAYGKRLQWQKMLRKGELREAADMTKNGDPIKVKKLHHFTLSEIFNNMKMIIENNAASAAKALADKKAKEEEKANEVS